MKVIGRYRYKDFGLEIGMFDEDEKECIISRESDGQILQRMYFRFNTDWSTILDAAERQIDSKILPAEFALQQE